MTAILIQQAEIVTMNEKMEIRYGDIWIKNDRIVKIGEHLIEEVEPGTKIIEAEGRTVLPGFIQTHTHLCQALFRGQADDMELMDWLKQRIWPLEAAHDHDSLYHSAKLGIGELIQGGTTTIMDMETVHHTDAAFEAMAETGIRALSGKVMMDVGDELPPALLEQTDASIAESIRLLERWHGYDNNRIQYAFCPRFVVSCTETLLKNVRDLSKDYDVMVHTHASENQGEVTIVEQRHGMRNVEYLDHIGLANERLVLAHCIWLNDQEKNIIRDKGVKMTHCPGSNLKLASGVADVHGLNDMGASISLGADGAPCNNTMDMFQEMKLAALLPKPFHGPSAVPALDVLKMATIQGAEALGLQHETGSLEEGKKADMILLDLQQFHSYPSQTVDPVSRIVYSASAADVDTTIIDGRVVMENRIMKTMDKRRVLQDADEAVSRLVHRTAHLMQEE
ncbi:5'-deoxyadenosine deaminase [Salibacterium qingdaonense]|uniref:5-methylthioadenosine/S-adenosylhomocysteine deaminase n=1 Tax=Salibacterium qingdaonense TaxID=266892 RepID=A0A1I4HX39_9BACI|nr:5'-deoxyadenosine deaminase [Salibacterium qingdaonense]SFL46313.1 Cytosine/adenosine deaminase [Salibacterium qingdaonense]